MFCANTRPSVDAATDLGVIEPVILRTNVSGRAAAGVVVVVGAAVVVAAVVDVAAAVVDELTGSVLVDADGETVVGSALGTVVDEASLVGAGEVEGAALHAAVITSSTAVNRLLRT